MPAIQATITHLPIDWVILTLFALLMTIGTLRSGTKYAVAFSLAAPLALVAASTVSYTYFIGAQMEKTSMPYVQVATFGVLVIILCVSIYFMFPKSISAGALPLAAILAGLACAAILAVVWLQIPLIANLSVLSPLLHTVFGAPFRLFWMIGAYLALAIASR